MKTGKQILKDFFDAFDVEYVFGNPGTTETTFLDVVSTHPSCKFIMGLHESTATGVAAGYAVKSGKTTVLNIHTYPGLANAMSAMFNAYAVGIPMLVIAGQQNRQHLIHKPILSGELTELAKTATKSQYQVNQVSDMNIILQRSYLEAEESKMPTFVSIPMEIYKDECDTSYYKPTQLLNETAAQDLSKVATELRKHAGKIVFVADAEAAWSSDLKHTVRSLCEKLDADAYLAPFALMSMLDVTSSRYKGILPAISSDANQILSQYETIVLLGEKTQSFLFHEKATVPSAPQLIQFSDGNTRIRYDYPSDYVVRGNIGKNLSALLEQLNDLPAKGETKVPSYTGKPTLLVDMLQTLGKDTAIVIEGSSHQNAEEAITTQLQFQEVYYEPRGGALGMAMPFAVGVALKSQKHTVCLSGDGGSMYSIQSIWTAAHYNVPVIFICFVNHEYEILKQLWKLQVPDSQEKQYEPIMDIKNPNLDLHKIAEGFGARVHHATQDNYKDVLNAALQFRGPTFITIPDDHKYSV